QLRQPRHEAVTEPPGPHLAEGLTASGDSATGGLRGPGLIPARRQLRRVRATHDRHFLVPRQTAVTRARILTPTTITRERGIREVKDCHVPGRTCSTEAAPGAGAGPW